MKYLRELWAQRLRDASLIMLVPAVAAGFALNGLLFQVSIRVFRDGELHFPIWNLYVAFAQFVSAVALLALAAHFGRRADRAGTERVRRAAAGPRGRREPVTHARWRRQTHNRPPPRT